MEVETREHINPITLKIRQKKMEDEYREYSISQGIKQFRYAFALGVLLFLIFIVNEGRMFPETAHTFLKIRLYLAVPVIVLAFLSTFFNGYRRHAHLINLLTIMIIGLSIVLMTLTAADNPNVGIMHYYVYMVFFFLYPFFRMPYRDTLFVGVVLSGAILTVDWYSTGISGDRFVYYAMVLLSGNLVGVSIAYVVEYQAKKEFLLKKRLAESVIKDALTGLYNRHYFEQILIRDIEDFISRSKKVFHIERRLGDIKTAKYGLFMVDIDYFKRINDTFGHHSGDLVLRQFAALLKESVRKTDDVLRVGGEEFLVVLKLTTDEYMVKFMKTLGQRIENHDFILEGGAIIGCTASMGLVVVPNTRSDDPTELVNYADRALYRSKDRGRNRGHRAYELQGEVEFEEILWHE